MHLLWLAWLMVFWPQVNPQRGEPAERWPGRLGPDEWRAGTATHAGCWHQAAPQLRGVGGSSGHEPLVPVCDQAAMTGAT